MGNNTYVCSLQRLLARLQACAICSVHWVRKAACMCALGVGETWPLEVKFHQANGLLHPSDKSPSPRGFTSQPYPYTLHAEVWPLLTFRGLEQECLWKLPLSWSWTGPCPSLLILYGRNRRKSRGWGKVREKETESLVSHFECIGYRKLNWRRQFSFSKKAPTLGLAHPGVQSLTSNSFVFEP